LLFVRILFGSVFIVGGVNCSPRLSPASYQPEIAQIMQDQTLAWNRGDLEAFMEPYWQSDSLVFVGESGPTYGWDQTLQNYKRSYPSPEAMGKLTFTLLRTSQIAPEALLVIGKWHLSRNMGNLEGHFSLVFRKIGGKWKIIADHSS